MPAIADDYRSQTPRPIPVVRRLSTPGPVVSRWEDDASLLPPLDLSTMFASDPTTESLRPVPVETQDMTLSLPTTRDLATQLVDYRANQRLADTQEQQDQALQDKRLQGASYAVASYYQGSQPTTGTSRPYGGVSAYGWNGVTGTKATRGTARYGLQPEMWAALGKANAAMRAAGLGTFTITDGWRSLASQEDLKRRKPKLAAKPGTSIHGLGYAVDIGATRRQKEWLNQHGREFGIYAPIFAKEDWHFQMLPSLARPSWGRQ